VNVLIVNTSEKTGGAAIAANRLMSALIDNGVKAKMLVCNKQTDNLNVVGLPGKLGLKLKFVWERVKILVHNRFSMRNHWAVDIACSGTDITKLTEFAWADVIHLHWINQGMLSLADIEKILDSGKRLVWTLHDQWPYTGICHYAEDCTHYQSHCHHCPLLKSAGAKDLSYKTFDKKMSLYSHINRVRFVGCSQWIADFARLSRITTGHVFHIPNAIDQTVFCPTNRNACREVFGLPKDKTLLLFSSLKVTDERKGIRYLMDACKLMVQQHPESVDNLGIVVVGTHTKDVEGLFPFTLYPIDYISDEARMAKLYTAVDAFITPSLQDNLPNTIVEAMSCGTPCVGFRVGGIPEMIHHQEDGYLAAPRDAQQLADGILYVVDAANHERLSQAAAHFAAQTYNPSHVARQYIEVYSN